MTGKAGNEPRHVFNRQQKQMHHCYHFSSNSLLILTLIFVPCFPRWRKKKCVVYYSRGERSAFDDLFLKNEIWLFIVTDTCNSPNMPGDSEPNSEIGYRKAIGEA